MNGTGIKNQNLAVQEKTSNYFPYNLCHQYFNDTCIHFFQLLFNGSLKPFFQWSLNGSDKIILVGKKSNGRCKHYILLQYNFFFFNFKILIFYPNIYFICSQNLISACNFITYFLQNIFCP